MPPTKRGRRPLPQTDGVEVAPPATVRQQVAHSLGEYWTCPDHIPEYGGETTAYTHDHFFCIDHLAGTFPSNVLSLIHLCIEDHHIWVMQYEEAQNMQAYVEEMEREWPGGRPEDFEYHEQGNENTKNKENEWMKLMMLVVEFFELQNELTKLKLKSSMNGSRPSWTATNALPERWKTLPNGGRNRSR